MNFWGAADPHATPITEHYSALQGVASHFEYEWRGDVLELRLGPLRSASGQIIGCLGAAVDVSDRKRSEEQALYQARHDGLTGLANYRAFIDRFEAEARRAERSHHSFTLLLLDLDQLKRINDLQGHLAGNRALRRLAAVMKEHCRATDLAARYGGDEFAVLAEHVAQRIEQRLRSDHEKPQLSASIGIGVYPDTEGLPPKSMKPQTSGSTAERKTQATEASLLPDGVANPASALSLRISPIGSRFIGGPQRCE